MMDDFWYICIWWLVSLGLILWMIWWVEDDLCCWVCGLFDGVEFGVFFDFVVEIVVELFM